LGYYPIVLEMTGRRCLIVGGGDVAARKARKLAQAGADITVIAPEIDPRIRRIEDVSLFQRPFQRGDTAGFSLVFAATGNSGVNTAVARDAGDSGIWVNAVDDPERCTFIAPSVVERGDLMICISTSGRSPALSRRLREEIERLYGEEYGEFVALLGSLRPMVKAKYGSQEEREAAFSRLIDGGILELLREGKSEEAREKALECI
jgi:precorrin-2 dehydrogenase / sirohydrochlorin ferrochelatase